MRKKDFEAMKRHSEILSRLGQHGSSLRAQMEDYRWYMGHIVTASGLIIGPKGVRNPTMKMIRRKNKDGTFEITGGVDKHEVAINYNGKMTFRSYGRFLYAAFNEDFDINDNNLVVVSTTEFRFEKSPYNYKVQTREEFFRTKGLKSQLYHLEERKVIYEAYKDVKGKMTIAEFASKLGTSLPYMELLLKEGRNGFTDSK